MTRLRRFPTVLAAVALAVSLPAGAAPGCQLARVAQWPLKPGYSVPVIEGAINGKPADFVINTGVNITTIESSAATQLGLERHREPNLSMQARNIDVERVDFDEIRVGTTSRKGFQAVVAPERYGAHGVAVSLGRDYFEGMEIEFDLPNHVVRLFKAKDCEGASLAYWAPSGAGVAELEPSGAIVFIVQVNGRRARAELSQANYSTVLSRSFAESVGVTPESPGTAPAGCFGSIAGKPVDMWMAPFEAFVIGDEAIRNPHLHFADLGKRFARPQMGSHYVSRLDVQIDLLMGADFLRSHRVLISPSQKRMYFTYSGGPVFRADARPDCQG